MAHIVVYLQRTPLGVHPGSAAALCLARDLASERGASVTALCAGDAGPLDQSVVRAAGRFGADVMLFTGPSGLEHLVGRLRPAHVLTPFSAEGQAAVSGIAGGPPVPRWLDDPQPSWQSPDAVTGIIAGVLPWHELPTALDSDYEGDVEQVPMPPWVIERKASGPPLPPFRGLAEGPLLYVAPAGVDEATQVQLETLGARPLGEGEGGLSSATILWLDAQGGELPDLLANRGIATRLVLLPGAGATVHPSWALCDWVLPGRWPDTLSELRSELWTTAFV